MTTLSIYRPRYSTVYTLESTGDPIVDIPFGSFSTRPDPIRRAWGRLEAKWWMNRKPEAPATPGPWAAVKRSALLRWIRRVAPCTPTSERANESQRVSR